ncbi:hypothetical protein San01_50640 [Streptomyces angustmyceticus]|uniref:Methyltransferase domain-containing protein n=1 Tax=Streptomyces angustmyceticus TaxID=285578 RepID=A0A5J4LEI4_9ACTN|nr:hypothetical protein San01_50640 [Streptomyces angustmyceticus]
MGIGPNTDSRWGDTRPSYGTVAASHANQMRNLLDEAPGERAVLALFAELVRSNGEGPVADVGCGPGRITACLHQLSTGAFGIDDVRPPRRSGDLR